MGLKLIVTGSTGMVGEGVLLHCLRDARVEKVLSVSRRATGHTHPRLTELQALLDGREESRDAVGSP